MASEQSQPSRHHPGEIKTGRIDPAAAKINRSSLHAQLTGAVGADVSGKGNNVLGMLLAAGGPSDRAASGINASAAARKLGVHRSTVDRWIKGAQGRDGGSKPRTHHLKNLRKVSRQVASTKAGRKAAAAAARARFAGQTLKLTIGGKQGITPAGMSYIRLMKSAQVLDPAAFNAMLNAYETGGDRGLASWVTDTWQNGNGGQPYGYEADWGFVTMDDFSIDDPSQG